MIESKREELHRQLEQDKADKKALIEKLLDEDMLDEDGYPTDAALDIVEAWHWSDPKGWFEFINSIWYLRSWGWSEGEEPHEFYKDRMTYCYHISTAGWSGNESIIRSMQKNDMMWHLNWVQSRRGGHYIFELRDYGDE